MASGRPVLVWPYTGKFPTPGRTVLVAWNATREATRALHDSMPFLKRADRVVVASIAASPDESSMAESLVQSLVRRGVKAEPRGIVIAGEAGSPQVSAMLKAVRGRFMPQRVVALAHPGADSKLIPLLAERSAPEGGARAYVCRNFACKQPVDTTEDLISQLEE